MKENFLSVEAYGFGSADGPNEYYFEVHLYELINVEVCKHCTTQWLFDQWPLVINRLDSQDYILHVLFHKQI